MSILFFSEPSEHTNALHILDSLLRNYDRRATPTNHLGKFLMDQPKNDKTALPISSIKGVATEVECKLYVRSLGSINPDTMVRKIII